MRAYALLIPAVLAANSLPSYGLPQGKIPPDAVFVSADAAADIADGSIDRPFRSIEQARDHIRTMKRNKGQRASIFLREGIYHIDKPIKLDKEDSYVTIMPWNGERVELTGGRILDNAKFRKATAASGKRFTSKSRLKPGMEQKVYVYDLKGDGIPVGAILKNGGGWDAKELPPELSVDGKTQTLARYPNGDSDFLTGKNIRCLDQGSVPRDFIGKSPSRSNAELMGMKSPVFQATSLPENSRKWAAPHGRTDNSRYETDGWLSGRFAVLWAEDNCRIASRDGDEIRCEYPSMYGVHGNNMKLRATNLLCELDEPGEYYIDRFNGNDILYYYPENGSLEGKEIMLSTSDNLIMDIDWTSGLEIVDIIFSGTKSSAMNLKDCDKTLIDGCEFYNISKNAVEIEDNTKLNTANVVSNCRIHDMGYGGVLLSGGGRKQLLRSNDVVRNCEISNFSRLKSYTPAITLHGMGHTAEYNYIHDAPHMAILIKGNDNLVSHNKIVNTCNNTGDMAPIYLGRDLMMLGNEISYNYIENVNSDTKEIYGIYFDDSASGGIIRGNVLKNIGGSGILPNKGFGYYITDNIFIDIPGSYVLFSTYGTPQWKRPVPNEQDLKHSFYNCMATKQESIEAGAAAPTDAKNGTWNIPENIRKWIAHYDSLYNGLPDYSKKPRFRFSLGKKYFPAPDNSTTAFSDPNSLLCSANMTIMRNVTANAGDLTIFRSLYGGSNSSYTDPATFDTFRFRTGNEADLKLDLTTGKIAIDSPLAKAKGYGPEWIRRWNKNFTLSGIGPQK